MSVISVSHLTFGYDGSYDNIFDDVNFQIDTDWKLGFIGRNGRGKTTFLNLLMGKYPYRGSIHSSVDFEYFPYAVKDISLFTIDIMRSICPNAEEWEILKEVFLLDVDENALFRTFETLSNGERTKVLLAALFLGTNRFLLIDEPTNHLDEDARRIVGAYLKLKKGFILISHDRELLNTCVDHILSINRTNIEIQQGNFSTWRTNKQYRDEFEMAENEKYKKEISRLSKAVKRTTAWSDKVESSKYGTTNSGSKLDKGFVGHKSAKMMKSAKNQERRVSAAIDEKSKLLQNAEQSGELKITALPYPKDVLVSISNLSMFYGETQVGSNLSLRIEGGDRIAVTGKNGSGKSSLLKLICGEQIEYSGTLNVGTNLKISYVQQDTSRLLGGLKDYAAKYNIEESLYKAILIKLGFERAQFDKDIKDFSAGQKKKVLIARSLCEEAHLFVWDEPLNFIDVISRIQIEELLRQSKPTMIFVEHDRTFQKNIATKFIDL